MAVFVKAYERKLKFDSGESGEEKYSYVLRPSIYNKVDERKVYKEAALRSGVYEHVIEMAMRTLADVIVSWVTEGHSVPIPGLGTMRVGLRSVAVDDVDDITPDLIKNKRIIFIPCKEIKEALNEANVVITCIDRNGNEVRRIDNTPEE